MTINCKGRLINLSSPKIMGILNITPDSFYDGGKYKNDFVVLQQVEKMLNEGATFIDVGGYSSRPGADHISEDEEIQRVAPILECIIKTYPETLISVDTFRSKVAKTCLEIGAAIINDISAGVADDRMLDVISKHQVPYIMMHMKGTPQTMMQNTQYDDLIKEVFFYFSEKIHLAQSKKINDLIIDPGFGFAKTVAQNFHLLHHLQLFKNLELPILAGISRKSMIYKTLNTTAKAALNGTTVLNTLALEKGAHILRVHDVKEAAECIRLFTEMNANAELS